MRIQIITVLLLAACTAGAGVIDFEGLPDGTPVGSAYSGIAFSNATVLRAGVSLNEFDFPPVSGENVVFDDGGPISIVFATPVLRFSGFFTYTQTIAVRGFDSGGNLVAEAMSAFANNTVSVGDVGSTANELLQIAAAEIALVTITGGTPGGSFVADDFQFDEAASEVPEPATGLTFAILALAGFAIRGCSRARLCCVLSVWLAGMAQAAPSVNGVSAYPSSIRASTATPVLVTAMISDPTVIGSGVNLLRVDSTGRTLAVLGVLRDDGRNGDATPGDKVFSISINLTEPAGKVMVRVSAPFQGVLARVLSEILTISVEPPSALPADPASVAPRLSRGAATPLGEATSFLYTGVNPIQTGVDVTKMAPAAAGVIRGRVLTRDNQPLSGVRISIAKHAEFGQTLSRADGWFDMAVNAGGYLTVSYEKAGYFPVQRQVSTEWQDYRVMPEVVMIPPDSQGTFVDPQVPFDFVVARGTLTTDTDGTRQPTLLFPHATQATMVMPDGTRRVLPSFTVRVSEFTVGQNGIAAMPASLPPASKYTFAAEFTVDEANAAGAKTVEFSKPVIHYMENFLAWPVGEWVPVGFYDRDRSVWSGTPDGRVIKILSASGGRAVLDVTGAGVPATVQELADLGITAEEERQMLLLYPTGQTLWRVTLQHFSSVDLNGPLPGAPGDAAAPCCGGTTADKGAGDPCKRGGSIIDCHNQALGETAPIVGTPWSLFYNSNRQPGRRVAANTVNIRLTNTKPPASIVAIGLRISVAGQTWFSCYAPSANLTTTFTWNGLDAYGRALVGGQKVSATTYYFYPLLAGGGSGSSRAGGGNGRPSAAGVVISFAEFSALPGSAIGNSRNFPAQSQCARAGLSIKKDWTVVINGGDARGNSIAGWSLSSHHFYDSVSQTLLLGDGSRRGLEMPELQNRIVRLPGLNCLGADFGVGDGGAVSNACIQPAILAYAPDGSYYMANSGRIRKVGSDGIIRTVIGDANGGAPISQSGDGGPAINGKITQLKDLALSANGELFFLDDQRIRKIGLDGIVRAYAGTGEQGFGGDRGPALLAKFNAPSRIAIAADGTIYVADTDNHRIRKIDPDGYIRTIAGSGSPVSGSLAVYQAATGQAVTNPLAVAVSPSGEVLFSERGRQGAGPGGSDIPSRIRSIRPDGMILTVAGKGLGYSGDGGPAIDAGISNNVRDITIAPDGTIYFIDLDAASVAVRQIGIDGVVRRFAGSGFRDGDNGGYNRAALQTSLYSPGNLEFAPDGTLHFAEIFQSYGGGHYSISGPFQSLGLGETAVGSADGTEVYVFSQYGLHVRTLNPWTGSTMLTFGYDGGKRLVSITDAYGNVTQIERDGLGAPIGIVSPYGLRTAVLTTSEDMIGLLTNPAGEVTRFSYSGGLMTEMIDARNQRYRFIYDGEGRLTRDTDPANGSQALARTGTLENFEVAVTTGMGRMTKYAADISNPAFEKQRLTSPDGLVVPSESQSSGVFSVEYADQSKLSLTRTGDPRWSTSSPYLSSLQFRLPSGLTYNQTSTRNAFLSDSTNPFSLSFLQQQTTINGRTYGMRYDTAPRTFLLTSPQSRQSSIVLNANGRVAKTTYGNLSPVDYAYDARGRLSSMAQGAGAERRTVSFTYDAAGFLSTVTDPLGRVVQFARDAAGRVRAQTLPGNRTILYDYDRNGNLTSLTPPGKTAHTFAYNSVNLPISYLAPAVDGGGTNTSVATYNLDRQSQGLLRPDGKTVDIRHDSAGRTKTVTFPDGEYTLSYSGTTGQVDGVSTTNGISVALESDGSLVKKTTWSGAVSASVSRTFDNNLRLATISVNGANPIAYEYDNDGLIRKAGDVSVSRSPQTGMVDGTTLDSITDGYTYSSFGEVATHTVKRAAETLYALNFQRDKLGRISQKIETINGTTSTFLYDYDDAGRLWRVRRDGTVTESYTYDLNGNRLTALDVSASYDAQDRLLQYGAARFTYTAAGELRDKTVDGQVTGYSYDVFGSLRRVSLPDGRVVEYLIDSLNRRVGKKVNGVLVKTWLYHDGLRPIAEIDSAGGVARFVYRDNSNVPAYMIKAGVKYRLLTDQVGSVRMVVNALSGERVQIVEYDSFGRVISDSNPGWQPFGFAGGMTDPDTGLVRFNLRDYDAATGRWTTKDPALFRSLSSSLYVYTGNRPVDFKDPEGLWDAFVFGGAGFEVPLPVGPSVGGEKIAIVGYNSAQKGLYTADITAVGASVALVEVKGNVYVGIETSGGEASGIVLADVAFGENVRLEGLDVGLGTYYTFGNHRDVGIYAYLEAELLGFHASGGVGLSLADFIEWLKCQLKKVLHH